MVGPMGEKRIFSNTNDSIGRQGILYLIVGVSSALIEVVVFQSLYVFGLLSVGMSNVVAVVLSTAYNFMLNGRITFRAQGNKVLSLVKYLMLLLFNICFTTFSISWLVSMGCESLIAKIGTMGCVALWNFVLYRKFVFA